MSSGLSALDYAVLGLYVAAIVWLGFRALRHRRTGAEDYILASRTLTLPSFVATLVPSFFGGTLGVGEYSYRYGISNWLVQGVPYYVFALIYAWLLVPRIRRAPGMTIADNLESAYGRNVAMVGGLLVFILSSPADEVLMLGTLAQWTTAAPLWLCLILVTLVSVGFLFAGGLRSDVWANRLEFACMFGGFALVLPFAYGAIGSFEKLQAALPAEHLSASGGQPPLYILTWFFIALWTFVDPSFHQRVSAAKDVATARKGIIISVAFWCSFDFMTTSAGLSARALIPDLDQPLMAYPALADRLLPPVVKGLFIAGVASSTFAALGTTSFLSAISIAKDVAGRWKGAPLATSERYIRWGLGLTSIVSIGMALALPSVVDLWYTVGSCVIPGLLIPMLSVYFEPLRMKPGGALLCCLAGSLGAVAAWAAGSAVPFYPGLAASLAVWVFGRA